MMNMVIVSDVAYSKRDLGQDSNEYPMYFIHRENMSPICALWEIQRAIQCKDITELSTVVVCLEQIGSVTGMQQDTPSCLAKNEFNNKLIETQENNFIDRLDHEFIVAKHYVEIMHYIKHETLREYSTIFYNTFDWSRYPTLMPIAQEVWSGLLPVNKYQTGVIV